MPDLADAVLLAASLNPGEHTAAVLADAQGWPLEDIEEAVTALRKRRHLQQRRGNRAWGGTDRLRPSKAGEAACRATLRAVILDSDGS
jgi:hypothetical protein